MRVFEVDWWGRGGGGGRGCKEKTSQKLRQCLLRQRKDPTQGSLSTSCYGGGGGGTIAEHHEKNGEKNTMDLSFLSVAKAMV